MLFPHLSGGGTRLRPVSPRGAGELHGALPPAAAGAVAPETFGSLYCPAHASAVGAQFDVLGGDGAWVGTTTLFSLDVNAGRVRAGVHLHPGAGAHEEAATLLGLNYAFSMWRLRKAYLWSVSPEDSRISGLLSMADREAVLRDFIYTPGGPRNAYVFAVHRDFWEKTGTALLEPLLETPDGSWTS